MRRFEVAYSFHTFLANVRGQGTRHLVEGTLDPLVGDSDIWLLDRLNIPLFL